MNAKTLEQYINNKASRARSDKLRQLYFFGENPEIYRKVAMGDPDNRVPVPFARRITLMYKGYIGKPGNITYSGELFDSYLKDIYWDNDEELATSEALQDALVYGNAFELHWMDEGEHKFGLVPHDQGIIIYTDSIKPKKKLFIRTFINDDGFDSADVYTDEVVQRWIKVKKEYELFSEEPHGFGEVPVVDFVIDSNRKNIFDHVIPLIDIHDKLISEDVANELERYAQSLLALNFTIDDVTEDENGMTEIDKMKFSRTIQNVQGKISEAIQYITKPPVDNFINTAADREERLIYENAMLLNPNDPNWGNASGETAKWKTWPFELMSASIEAYFSRGLYDRARIIAAGGVAIGRSVPDNDLSIRFNRNLPRNLLEIAQISAMAENLIGAENALKLWPTDLVPNVEKILEEKAERVNIFADVVEDESGI